MLIEVPTLENKLLLLDKETVENKRAYKIIKAAIYHHKEIGLRKLRFGE